MTLRLTLPGALVLAVLAALTPTQVASAAWSASGLGAGQTNAISVQRASAPTATAVGASVRLDWDPVTLADGTSVLGYAVLRDAGAGAGDVTEVCTTAAPIRTCTDDAPVRATASYSVVARFLLWEGEQSPPTSFTPDLVPPVTTLTSTPAPNGAGWNNTAPVGISLTATDDDSGVASITYRIGTGAWVTVAGSTATFTVAAEGQTTISYYATDVAGSVESTRSYTVRIDTVAPASPSLTAISDDTGASASDLVTNQATQNLLGTAEPGATVTVSRGATTLGTAVAAGNGTFAVPLTLVEGTNVFTAVATDPAGNSSAPSAQLEVKLDTVAPTVTIFDPKDGVAYRNSAGPQPNRWALTCNGTPGACGDASDASSGVATVTVELRDTNAGTCWTGSGGNHGPCGPALTATGTTGWSLPIPYDAISGRTADRGLTLTASAVDIAGNAGTASVRFSADRRG